MKRSEFLGVLAALPVVGGLFKHQRDGELVELKSGPHWKTWALTNDKGTTYMILDGEVHADMARQVLASAWKPIA